MNKLNNVCFLVSNLLIQDYNTDEYSIGNRSLFTLHANTDKPLTQSTGKKAFIKHVSDNHYEIRGYIYESKCEYALININGIRLSVCNRGGDYKSDMMYEGKVFLIYDVWSCYDMSVCSDYDDEALYLEGITKNIQLITTDTSKNITLYKTSSWDDRENYQNATSSYLIEVELCADKILHENLNPLQIDNNSLTLNLSGISKNKINKIEDYIKKVCRLSDKTT